MKRRRIYKFELKHDLFYKHWSILPVLLIYVPTDYSGYRHMLFAVDTGWLSYRIGFSVYYIVD
jgi:hypothetical protein